MLTYQLVTMMVSSHASGVAGGTACSGEVDASAVCRAAATGTVLMQLQTDAEFLGDGENDTLEFPLSSDALDPKNETEVADSSGPVVRMFDNAQYLSVNNYGVWDRSNAFSREQRPFLRGWGAMTTWADIEPEEGRFNWTELDNALTKAYESKGSFYAMVAVGPDSPQWIYKQAIKVQVERDRNHHSFYRGGYPYYLDPIYISLRDKMINTLGSYLRQHVHSANVGFVQLDFGCTGDSRLYKTEVIDSNYLMDFQKTYAHMVDTWQVYKRAFQDGAGRIIPISLNPMRDNDPGEEFAALETFTALGRKAGPYVRGHHLSGERTYFEHHRLKFLNGSSHSPTPFYFARSEHDQTWKKALFQINLPLAFYWAIINGLTEGLSIHDVSADALSDSYKSGFADSFEFFNLYATQVWPHNSTRAFIALHEGLDAHDLAKFPAGKEFGPMGENLERVMKICAEYAHFGCKVEDPQAAFANDVSQRSSQTHYNDVGYDIWPTNYGRWIEQIDADVTSQGLFRVGGQINRHTSKYARFARGLRHSGGKRGMYFKLSDGFFATTPPDLLDVHLIWFDNARGSFQIKHTDQSLHEVVALDQACAGDKEWKHAYFVMHRLSIGRSKRGSDFFLESKDSTDAIVHMIEISRFFG